MAVKRILQMCYRKSSLTILISTMLAAFIALIVYLKFYQPSNQTYDRVLSLEKSLLQLPAPIYSSGVSIEQALLNRRSVREYKNGPVSLNQLSQLLWAAQGITSPEGFRTAPSAGALYALEIYIVTRNVKDLPVGVYHYLPKTHSLQRLSSADKNLKLSSAIFNQTSAKTSALNIIIAAIESRTKSKYGSRTARYVAMEAGHAAQNIYLQTVSLKLGTVALGAFDEDKVKKAIDLPNDFTVLYLMPVGAK